MTISLIVAMDRHGLIGTATGLPWHLSADLKRFRKLTTGKPIILGRKTLEQVGRPLPDRLNIVMTRATEFQANGCTVVHSLEEALKTAKQGAKEMGTDEIFIIGGAEVYRQALPLVDRVYLTVVEGEFAGNAWFPFDPPFAGRVNHEERLPADAKNPHAHRFLIIDRQANGESLSHLLTMA